MLVGTIDDLHTICRDILQFYMGGTHIIMKRKLRKNLSRFFVGAAALSMIFTATSCGKDNGNIEVTVITKKPSGAYWETIMKGALDAGEEMGIDVVFKSVENETQIDEQKQLVIDAGANGTDAIVLAPCTATDLNEAINAVSEKGIPVVTIDSDAPESERKCCISTQNKSAGSIAARAASDIIGGEGEIGIIGNTATAQTVIDRIGGFVDQLNGVDGIKVLDPRYCDGDKEKAASLAKELIQSNKNLKLIFSTNETSTLGICSAIEELGRSNDVQVVGFDCSSPVVGYINDGVVDATVVQNPYNMGYLGVRNAYKAYNGEEISSILDTGATLVTGSNINDDDIGFLINPMGN